MAEMLKRQYDLLALKFAMDLSTAEPRVHCELQGRSDDQFATLRDCDWSCLAEEIGLPERLERSQALYQGYAFKFPTHILEDLKVTLQESDYKDRPLWLHLSKPLGYLGLVPWEQLLQPELKIPILRLPDFLAEPPRESFSTLNVIMCSSLPAAKESFMAVEHLGRMVERILQVESRRTMIHLFTDKQIVSDVRNCIQQKALPAEQVHIYDPNGADAYPSADASTRILEQPGRISNPWLLWMRDSLQGRSVDVVHFLAHGFLSRNQGALALAESPLENEDRRTARFVGPSELLTFLTQVGAWSVAFSSPKQNYSEMGLRLLADTIAQIRPGPVLHHTLSLDQEFAAMADAYAFLFGGGDGGPPASPALFTYCHPSLVEEPAQTRTATRGARRGSKRDAISSMYESEEGVPSWIAATERYIEQRELEADRMIGAEVPSETTRRGEYRQRDANVIRDTLREIQDVMARVAIKRRSGGE